MLYLFYMRQTKVKNVYDFVYAEYYEALTIQDNVIINLVNFFKLI